MLFYGYMNYPPIILTTFLWLSHFFLNWILTKGRILNYKLYKKYKNIFFYQPIIESRNFNKDFKLIFLIILQLYYKINL